MGFTRELPICENCQDKRERDIDCIICDPSACYKKPCPFNVCVHFYDCERAYKRTMAIHNKLQTLK